VGRLFGIFGVFANEEIWILHMNFWCTARQQLFTTRWGQCATKNVFLVV